MVPGCYSRARVFRFDSGGAGIAALFGTYIGVMPGVLLVWAYILGITIIVFMAYKFILDKG